ncbi:hypothetical protein J6590_089752 [Homalodisca vitripennis]|nr:hypothetical protein J6590_089752 [Homalodisca vitripennis]
MADTDLASIRWACLPVTGAFPNAPGAALDYCLNLKNKYKLIHIHKRTRLLNQNSTMSSATELYSEEACDIVLTQLINIALQTLPTLPPRVGTCHVAPGPVSPHHRCTRSSHLSRKTDELLSASVRTDQFQIHLAEHDI